MSSCASVEPLDYQGADAGHLIMTSIIGRGAKNDASYSIIFRESDDHKVSKGLYYSPSNIFFGKNPDFKLRNGKGFVHVVKLKPGKYEVYKWYAAHNNWSVHSDEYVVSEFTIYPGKATYSGAYTFQPFKGENVFGMQVFGGLEFVPSYDVERDYEIAVTKNPEIKKLELVDANKGRYEN